MGNERYHLSAPCHFGLESVLSGELRRLGAENISATDGRVAFEGDAEMMEVNVYNGEELLFSLYVRDDHLWKHFVPYIQKSVTITESNA